MRLYRSTANFTKVEKNRYPVDSAIQPSGTTDPMQKVTPQAMLKKRGEIVFLS